MHLACYCDGAGWLEKDCPAAERLLPLSLHVLCVQHQPHVLLNVLEQDDDPLQAFALGMSGAVDVTDCLLSPVYLLLLLLSSFTFSQVQMQFTMITMARLTN